MCAVQLLCFGSSPHLVVVLIEFERISALGADGRARFLKAEPMHVNPTNHFFLRKICIVVRHENMELIVVRRKAVSNFFDCDFCSPNEGILIMSL
jgi:hypothetical protein